MPEIRISHSSLTEFLKCRYMYYLRNVLRLKGPKALAPLIGIAAHEGVAAHYRGKPVEDALQKAWGKEVGKVPPAELAADPGALQAARDMVATYIAKAPAVKPALVEAPFLLRLDGVTLSGSIDLVDDADNVHDHKFKTGRKSSTFDAARYRIQMTMYALGFRALTGRGAKKLLLDVVSRAGRFKEYEVEPDFAGLREVVALTSSSIMQGEYEPTGAMNGSCGICDFRNTCGFSTAREI